MHFLDRSPTRLEPGFDFSDPVLQAAPGWPCLLDPVPRHLTEVHWPELVNAWQAQVLRALAQPVQLETEGPARRVQVLGQVIFNVEPTGEVAAWRWRQDHREQRFVLERLFDADVVVQGVPEQSSWLDALKGEALLALYRRFPEHRSDCRNYVAWVGRLLLDTYWGEGTRDIVRRQIAEALALDPAVLAVAARIQLTDSPDTSVRLLTYNPVMRRRANYRALQQEAPQLLQLFAMLTDDPVGELFTQPLPEEPTARMKQQLQDHGIGAAMWRLLCHEGSDWMKPLMGFFEQSEQTLVEVAIDLLSVAQAFGTQALAPGWLLHAFLQLGGSPNRPRSGYAERLNDLFPLCARLGHLWTQADEANRALMQERSAEIFNWGCTHLNDLPDRALRHISLRGLLRRVDQAHQHEALALQHEPCWELPYRLTPTVGPFTPVILDSTQALWLDGKRMHHCVAQYTDACAAGTLLIVSLRDAAQARPVATVSFDLSGREVRLVQVAGFANHLAPPLARWAAQSCLEQLQVQKRAMDLERAAVPSQVREDMPQTGAPNTPEVTVCTLTRSDSYVEVLSLRPVAALPGQYEWRVQSQWLGARDRNQWQRRHQVLVDREALVELRAALDGVLGRAEGEIAPPMRRNRSRTFGPEFRQ